MFGIKSIKRYIRIITRNNKKVEPILNEILEMTVESIRRREIKSKLEIVEYICDNIYDMIRDNKQELDTSDIELLVSVAGEVYRQNESILDDELRSFLIRIMKDIFYVMAIYVYGHIYVIKDYNKKYKNAYKYFIFDTINSYHTINDRKIDIVEDKHIYDIIPEYAPIHVDKRRITCRNSYSITECYLTIGDLIRSSRYVIDGEIKYLALNYWSSFKINNMNKIPKDSYILGLELEIPYSYVTIEDGVRTRRYVTPMKTRHMKNAIELGFIPKFDRSIMPGIELISKPYIVKDQNDINKILSDISEIKNLLLSIHKDYNKVFKYLENIEPEERIYGFHVTISIPNKFIPNDILETNKNRLLSVLETSTVLDIFGRPFHVEYCNPEIGIENHHSIIHSKGDSTTTVLEIRLGAMSMNMKKIKDMTLSSILIYNYLTETDNSIIKDIDSEKVKFLTSFTGLEPVT